MPNLYPNKDELAAIRAAITEAKADPAQAEVELIRGFQKGDYTLDQLDSFLVVLKSEKPDLWTTKAKAAAEVIPPEKAAEIAELSAAAFTGERHRQLTARAKLIRLVGDDEADKIAKTYGVAGFRDFASKGKAPKAADDDKSDDESAEDGEGDKNTKPSKNPWSARFKGTPAEIEVAKVHVIRVMGTKAAANMSRAAGVTLTGAPLKVA